MIGKTYERLDYRPQIPTDLVVVVQKCGECPDMPDGLRRRNIVRSETDPVLAGSEHCMLILSPRYSSKLQVRMEPCSNGLGWQIGGSMTKDTGSTAMFWENCESGGGRVADAVYRYTSGEGVTADDDRGEESDDQEGSVDFTMKISIVVRLIADMVTRKKLEHSSCTSCTDRDITPSAVIVSYFICRSPC